MRGLIMILNKIKTVLFLALLSGVFMGIGMIFGGKEGLQIALIFALIMNTVVYFFSEKIVLRMYGAKPLDKQHYHWVYTIIEELTKTMKLPMPKIWLVATPMANAFATGRNPQHSSIALTSGIIEILDHNELRGVIAHELSHIKNRDILVATIAATIATAIGCLANMAHYTAFWGSISNNRRRGNNPIIMLIVAMLMPIAATIIQLVISRSREYLADESGAYYSQDPLALASALEKLHNNIPYAHLHENDTQRASTAPLFIVHPFTKQNIISLFSTHPPIHKRITRLRQMYEKMF